MHLEEIFNKNNLLIRYKRILFTSSFVLLCSFFFCHLDENVIAEGIIRPDKSEVTIKAIRNGIIQEVLYTNSQFIRKESVLFYQNTSIEEENLKNLIKLREAYVDKITTLNELLLLLENTTVSVCNYDLNLVKKNTYYCSFVNQYKNYQSEFLNKKKYLERQQFLYPGIISKQELENIEFDFLQSKLSFSNWIEVQKIENLEKFNSTAQLLEDCNLNILQTENVINNASARSPIDGYINEINKLCVGDYITEGTPVLSIVPKDTKLKCILHVSNSNISKINIGQKTFLQIKDLPFTKYGKIQGTVSLIPQDSIISEKSYFPVEILLDKNFVESKSLLKKEKIFLKVGSKVTGKIIVDSNTVFEKILEKVVLHDK